MVTLMLGGVTLEQQGLEQILKPERGRVLGRLGCSRTVHESWGLHPEDTVLIFLLLSPRVISIHVIQGQDSNHLPCSLCRSWIDDF